MSPDPRPPAGGLTLRAMLVALVLGGALYVGAISVFIAARVQPTATALQLQSEELVRQYAASNARAAASQQLMRRVREHLFRVIHPPVGGPPGDSRWLREEVMMMLDSAVAARAAAAQSGLLSEPVIGQAVAAYAESRLMTTLLEVLAAADLGRGRDAEVLLSTADSLGLIVERQRSQALGLAMRGLTSRERSLGAAARRALLDVGWWLAIGAALLPLAVLLVHRRFYRPLADLDAGLTRVATGELTTAVPVHRGDELGRLSAQFNQMTAVLRERAAEERRRATDALRRSEERYRQIVETAEEGIWLLDADDRTSFVNQKMARMLGYEPREMVGRLLFDFLDDESRELSARHLAARRLGVKEQYDLRYRRRDGSPLWAIVSANPIFDETGRYAGALGMVTDITDRQRAEQVQAATLRIAEAANTASSLQELLGSVHQVVGELMPARDFYIALYDEQADRLSFPYFVDHVDPPPPPRRPGRGLTEYVLRTGQPLLAKPDIWAELQQRGEVELVGGSSHDWLGVPLKLGERVIGVIAVQTYSDGLVYGEREKVILQFVSTQIARAIERKRSEEALRESEERYRRLAESSPDGITVIDDGRVRYVNRAGADLVGAPTAEELIGRPILDFIAEESLAVAAQRIAGVLQGERDLMAEVRMRRLDGSFVDVEAVGIAMQYEGRTAVMTVGRDITQRKRAEEQIRLLAQAVKSTTENISITDLEGRFTFVNRAFLEGYGYELDEVLGQSVALIDSSRNPPGLQAEIRAATTRGGWSGELYNRRKDGTHFPIALGTSQVKDQDGRVIALMGVWSDITERKQVEERAQQLQESLRRSETMAAMGALVAGVAHEVRNPLFSISATLDAFEARHAKESADNRSYFEVLREAVQRLTILMRDLLEYGRPLVVKFVQASLGQVVVDAVHACASLAERSAIRVVTRIALDLPPVSMDRNRLSQVFINLVTNAIQHSPAGGEVVLTVDARGRGRSPAWLDCDVRDAGSGFPETVLPRVFEPFFSRRRGGTGLGLAIVQRIVDQHRGIVVAANHPDGGAVVRVSLPAAVPEPATSGAR